MKSFFSIKKEPKFSLILLLISVVIFTGLGIYLIYRAFGAATIDVLKAELYVPSGKSVERISGPDRYSTAVGISKKTFPVASGGTIIVASGENWPDSASGAVLARTYNAPILLTPKSSLNIYTKNEINRIRPNRVIILGATGAVSDAVLNNIKLLVPGATVERIYGADRYETAAKIAARVYQANGNKIPDNTVMVATGNNFPDVLSGAAVAAAKGYPILYVSTNMPAVTKSTITSMGITRTLVVGGTAAIPDAVKNQLPGAIRLAGANRYSTSVKVNDWALRSIPGFTLTEVGIASGENFPDALTAGPFIASRTTPGLLILSSSLLSPETANYLSARKASLKNVYVFGGDTVISSSAYMTLANYIGYGFTSRQITTQAKVDARIKLCPLLSATTADYSTNTDGYQAVAYYTSGRIVVNPNHTSSLDTILNHEIYHIYDWRDNGRIDWGESVPRTSPDCIP